MFDGIKEPTGTQSRSPPFPTISSQALNDASEEYDPDNDGDEAEDEGFGDDFDDFEEGEAADDDFGDFDDGFATTPTPQAPAPHPPPPQPAHSFVSSISTSSINAYILEFLNAVADCSTTSHYLTTPHCHRERIFRRWLNHICGPCSRHQPRNLRETSPNPPPRSS